MAFKVVCILFFVSFVNCGLFDFLKKTSQVTKIDELNRNEEFSGSSPAFIDENESDFLARESNTSSTKLMTLFQALSDQINLAASRRNDSGVASRDAFMGDGRNSTSDAISNRTQDSNLLGKMKALINLNSTSTIATIVVTDGFDSIEIENPKVTEIPENIENSKITEKPESTKITEITEKTKSAKNTTSEESIKPKVPLATGDHIIQMDHQLFIFTLGGFAIAMIFMLFCLVVFIELRLRCFGDNIERNMDLILQVRETFWRQSRAKYRRSSSVRTSMTSAP